MTALVWLIQHVGAVVWILCALITGAWLWYQVRRELTTPRPPQRRPRYPRRP